MYMQYAKTNKLTRWVTLGLAVFLTLNVSASRAQCDDAEVGYVASFAVKPGSEAGFEAALTKLAETVNRVEQGVILYAPYRGTEGKYFMMERYANEAARAAHGQAPEVAELFPGLGEFLAAPPAVNPVSAICP